jgi:DNA sulfur modification protein DndD
MRFEKLVLENFSSYYGKHVLELHTTDKKPVAIIIGGGGKGKTSIFDALNWALYGVAYETTLEIEEQKGIVDYVNESALYDAIQSNSSVEMACSLYFEHENKHYRIQQAICVKQENGTLEISDRTSALHEYSSTGNLSTIPRIDLFLNEILPNNVRDYFLFNGDRINRLSLPGSSEEIRDGIYRVVDLELLQNGTTHLLEVAKKFRRYAKDSSVGEVAEIESQYFAAHEQYDELKAKNDNYQAEKRAIEDKIEVISNKLRSLDETIKLQSKRDVLQERHKNNVSAQKDIIIQIRSTAAIASLGVVAPEINQLEKTLGDKKGKGEIPSSISENLLKDILEIGKCICGTEFKAGDKVHKHLQERLRQAVEKENKGQELLDLFFGLRSSKSQIRDARQKLSELEKRRTSTMKAQVEIEKQLNETLQKLKKVPDEDISKLTNNYEELNNDLTTVRINIQTTLDKMRVKDEEIRRLRIRRDELSENQAKVRKFQLRDNLAQKASEELEKIFQKFADDSREEIQSFTREEFQKFIPTANALSVGINSEFHYDVRDQNGNPALQQLSNGQKQALSLAYITSISRVSEKNPPLVIDMPFGRLDEDVQDNIARRLPELASQVILLVLPGPEWNEHTESILRSKASDLYELEFDEKRRQTTIRKA